MSDNDKIFLQLINYQPKPAPELAPKPAPAPVPVLPKSIGGSIFMALLAIIYVPVIFVLIIGIALAPFIFAPAGVIALLILWGILSSGKKGVTNHELS